MGDDAGRDRMISELVEGAASSAEEASQNQKQLLLSQQFIWQKAGQFRSIWQMHPVV